MSSVLEQSVIDVTDLGATRRVRVLVPQRGSYADTTAFESPWPETLLHHLAELKGQWFLDSYHRFEHPNYIQKQVDTVLNLYGLQLGDEPVLDFGCGFGASSYCLIKRGAKRILAADLERKNTDFATAFFAETGLSDRVQIRHEDVVPTLDEGSFSVIWLQAVMEHLLPDERQRYLRRFWQALRPSGVLIITETPNRVWPIERHTTGGTWWIPWMKPHTAFRKMRAVEKYRGYCDEDFYRCGIIGSSYREILDCLGRPSDCVESSLHVRGYLKYLYSHAVRQSAARRTAIGVLGLAEPLTRALLRRPITAFMPFLNHLVFTKV